MGFLRFVGRMALAPVFIYGGLDVLQRPEGRVKVAAEAGAPQPDLAVKANAAVMVGAGTLLLLGIAPRLAASALLASLVPTTLAGHRFWEKEDAERRQQITQAFKNLAAMGGLLMIVAGDGRKR